MEKGVRMKVVLIRAFLCTLGLGGSIAAAQTPQYKVLSSNEIFIYDQSGKISSVQVVDRSARTVTLASGARRVAAASSWWDVIFPGNVFKITDPATAYEVLYNIDDKPAPPLQVSLSPKLSITIGTFGTVIRDYWLNSNVVLQTGNQYLMDTIGAGCGPNAADGPGTTGGWKNITLKNKSKTTTVHGRMQVCTASLDEAKRNPAALGAIRISLDYALVWRQNSFTIDSVEGNSIVNGFTVDDSLISHGTPVRVVFADDATFNPQSAPASKDASEFYANLQIAAGTGTAAAWGIDGKVALFNQPFLHGTLTLLSATANTGNNTSNIKNTTYTDAIDWMLPAGWAYSLWKKAPTTLTLIAGPKYETDYRFDKKNLLFSGDSIWSAKKLYQPQSHRSKPKNGVMPKYGDPGYAKVGYELEFHAGIESGGALVDTTAQNTAKTQSITVPTYSIARMVPQIHALYQQSIGWAGLLSFDSTFTARYLFAAENTVRQATDGSLSIVRVSGWRAINTLTSTWNPPKNNNVGITVTFKDGFDAPKFSRVNCVLIGVLIQF
jgi:hypothetical protein